MNISDKFKTKLDELVGNRADKHLTYDEYCTLRGQYVKLYLEDNPNRPSKGFTVLWEWDSSRTREVKSLIRSNGFTIESKKIEESVPLHNAKLEKTGLSRLDEFQKALNRVQIKSKMS